jgi:hypothetical protein
MPVDTVDPELFRDNVDNYEPPHQEKQLGGVILSGSEEHEHDDEFKDVEAQLGKEGVGDETEKNSSILHQILDNLKASNLPDKQRRIEELRQKYDALLAEGDEENREARVAYETIRDHALARMLSAITGTVTHGIPITILEIGYEKGKIHAETDQKEGDKGTSLTQSQLAQLRTELYAYIGSTPPTPGDFTSEEDDYMDSRRYREARVQTNIPDLYVAEYLKTYVDPGSGREQPESFYIDMRRMDLKYKSNE